jgi:cell division protein FtsB
MAGKNKNTRRNVHRMAAQTRVLKTTNKMIIAAIFIAVALVFFATYLPEKHKLDKLLHDLEMAKNREADAEGRLDYLKIKLNALKVDPAFLEIQARDRLPFSRPGETIFQIER